MDILCLNLIYEHILIFKWFKTPHVEIVWVKKCTSVWDRRLCSEHHEWHEYSWKVTSWSKQIEISWFSFSDLLRMIDFHMHMDYALKSYQHVVYYRFTTSIHVRTLTCLLKLYFVCVHKQYIQYGRTISICLPVHLLHLCCMYTYNSIYFTTDR